MTPSESRMCGITVVVVFFFFFDKALFTGKQRLAKNEIVGKR